MLNTMYQWRGRCVPAIGVPDIYPVRSRRKTGTSAPSIFDKNIPTQKRVHVPTQGCVPAPVRGHDTMIFYTYVRMFMRRLLRVTTFAGIRRAGE